jgi:hypothetical protein
MKKGVYNPSRPPDSPLAVSGLRSLGIPKSRLKKSGKRKIRLSNNLLAVMTIVHWYELRLSQSHVSFILTPEVRTMLIREIFRTGTTSFPYEIDGVVCFQSIDLFPVRQAIAKVVAVGSVASGSVASGSVASGSVASGSVASGPAHAMKIVEIGIAGVVSPPTSSPTSSATSSQRCPNCASFVPNQMCPRCA